MTPNDRWILPDGIDEALPDEAWRLEAIRRRLIDLYRSWGYDLVIPPMIEYIESLLTGSGSQLDLQTFRLTDQLSGRMMGLRADMTPQVARIDANRMRRDTPTRLCYLGTVLRTRPDGMGGTRSPFQVGAELYGHAGAASDREILSLLMETFQACGVRAVHLDIGHAGIYREVSARAGLDRKQTDALFDMLQRKAVPEIEQWLAALRLEPKVHEGLAALAMLNGDREALKEARSLLSFVGDNVRLYLDMLESLGEMLGQRYPEVSINYDLAELRGYRYETGVVYAAYVPGEGREIARGGRYAGIGRHFGRARPAVGFSTDLKILQRLAGKDFSGESALIWAPENGDAELAETVASLRARGDCVIVALDGQTGPRDLGCTRRLINQGGQWVVQEIE